MVCLIDTSAEKPAVGNSEKPKAAPKSETPNPGPVSTAPKQQKTYATGHPSVAAKKLMDDNSVNSISIRFISSTLKGLKAIGCSDCEYIQMHYRYSM